MTFPSTIEDNSHGSLILEQQPANTEVYFIPKKNLLSDILEHDGEDVKWHLLDLDSKKDTLIIYPFKNWEEGIFENKYNFLKTITLIGFNFSRADSSEDILNILDALPSAFVKDYNYGLGLKREFACIIDMLEELHVSKLLISKKDLTSIDEQSGTCTIRFAEFEEIRKGINKVVESARSVASLLKRQRTYNTFAFYLKNEKYQQRGIAISDNLISRLVEKTSAKISFDTNKDEQKSAVEIIRKNTSKIIKEHPEEIIKLRNDLELVSLEHLINKFEINLRKKLNEGYWQELFNENPFILNMAFGYPIIKINDQASVGGRNLSGAGDKIVDFLVKNSISNNAALFEIKTPSTRLLNKVPYRNSVYIPSLDLTGAVNQVLDQKHKFEKSIINLKDNSRIYDLESYAVQGILVIGLSLEDHDQQKSFELYRGNSKSITIITFDEVLSKLKQLHLFLSPVDIEK